MIECQLMRKAFAALLVTCLLAMTSWASACDLSCSLEQFHSACKLARTTSGKQVEAVSSDMDMANMNMADEVSMIAQPENGLVHLHSNSCTHNPCNETSVSAISKSALHPVPALQSIAFERPTVAPITWQVTGIAPEREPPNPQPFDPLSVNLRI
jgi:hypothetical protein